MTRRLAKFWPQALKLVAILAFGVWVLVTYSVAKEIGQPFAGFRFEESLSVSPQNDPSWNGPRAGLASYDRLVSANGRALRESEDLKRMIRSLPPGSPIAYAIQRQDQRLTVTVSTQVLGAWDFTRAFLPTLLNGLLHLLVGAWVLWLRPTHAAAQAHFLLTLSIGTIYQVLGVDFTFAHWFAPAYVAGTWFMGAAGLHLALVLPDCPPPLRKYPWLPILAYVPAALMALVNVATYRPISHVLAQTESTWHPNLLPLWGFWIALGFCVVFFRMLSASLFAREPRVRIQARIVLAGMILAYLPSIVLYVLPVMTEHSSAISIKALALAYGCFLIFPLSVAYSVLRHQLFGITHSVKKTLTYTAVTASLGGVYVLLLEVTRSKLGLHSQAANILAIATLTLIFAPLYQRIQTSIDRLFGRSSVQAQKAAAAFGLEAQDQRDPERLLDSFARTTTTLLDPEFLAVFLPREGPELTLAACWGSSQALPVELPADFRRIFSASTASQAIVIPEGSLPGVAESLGMPLFFHGESIGYLLIGKRRAGHVYEEPERLFLTTMAQQLAVWLKNAQLFEHLSRRNAELSLANQHLKELDRLKDDFLNAASHELRTPLASIVGYSEFLEDGLGGPVSGEQAEYIGEIQKGARRLQRLVDDLLDFARLEAGSLNLDSHDSDLKQTISEVITSLVPQAKEGGVTLTMELPDESLNQRMDPRRIEQVLLNLAGNALKFTPQQGRVTIVARRVPGGCRVEVRDTGIGIPQNLLPLLFEKFFQVDPTSTRSYGGTGLGLSIAKAVVEAHGGEIGAESAEGLGSLFWFTLPGPESADPEPLLETKLA